MTTMLDRLSGTTTFSRRGLVIVLVLLATVALGGYLVGHRQAETADWHTVTIERADVVGDEGSHRILTVQVDGWSYGMENQVEYWIDEEGTIHEGEWPACLEPENPGAVPAANPGEVTFRFASTSVTAGVMSWRPIVMVDCRG